ncbi:ABC transporter ATP-binding protein [Nocardioides stalactiti]|uniref:ABC transporter ATP-binding protein n=1 Tax=Nocardioides stalactiti TaxID=2755356 RepID=UPI001602A046|nr:ABC transporter ATP-binding protein [Nocardioides stalactiti]
MTRTVPLIELEGVAKDYPGPPTVRALRDAQMTVGKGEYVSIVGRSGSGKSTLLNVVGLLDRPTCGRYSFAGVDTGSLSERRRTALRARAIGFVFQGFHLMPHRTVVENVGMGLIYQGASWRQRRRIAEEKLEAVGLGSRSTALPTMLSGGEMQRVAIARALACSPSLLLCDEPTGNLDSQTADGILQIVDDLVEAQLTVLMITHDPQVAARAHRSVVVRDGRLIHDQGRG